MSYRPFIHVIESGYYAAPEPGSGAFFCLKNTVPAHLIVYPRDVSRFPWRAVGVLALIGNK